MSYKITPTRPFIGELKRLQKKYPSLKNDIGLLGEALTKNPFEGTPLGRSCYKIRIKISSKGKGKSGGGRIVTCVKVLASTVFLLTIFGKSSKESITDKGLVELFNQSGLI